MYQPGFFGDQESTRGYPPSGVRGESTYCDPLAVTFRLQNSLTCAASFKALIARLGQRGELVIGAVPLDLLMELIAGRCGADPQMLDRGDIGEVI